ncbi:MAG TPA: hypothetical protein VLY46_00480, partial [Usitatibacter sp.]|nr:hypothetical protein [Usitatibacter sp.]
DLIVARALKKKPDERYGSAADLARDLWAAVPDVRAAEEARAAGRDSTTLPLGALASAAAADVRPLAMRDESIELRASPRFDSSQSLLRLPVLSAEGELARTHADVTPKPRNVLVRRVDAVLAAQLAVLAVATLAAAIIALG